MSRFSPLFDDGTDVLVALGVYDTKDEAKQAGAEHATEDLRFVGLQRHLHEFGFRQRDAMLRQRREQRTAENSYRWCGVVNSWKDGDDYGFITAADGTSWFLSCKDLPPGYTSLPVNTRVTFAGPPNCPPGKPRPRAYSVRIVE